MENMSHMKEFWKLFLNLFSENFTSLKKNTTETNTVNKCLFKGSSKAKHCLLTLNGYLLMVAQAFTCSKSIIDTLEKGVKYVQS